MALTWSSFLPCTASSPQGCLEMCPIPPSTPKSSPCFARRGSCSRKRLLLQEKKEKGGGTEWAFPLPPPPHPAEMEAKLSKSGQSDASLSEQQCPGEMGHFVPLDKIDPSYLHLMLLVPRSSSLGSLAEAFPPPPPPQTQPLMRYGKWGCRQPRAGAAVGRHGAGALCGRGTVSRAISMGSS